MTEDTKNIFLTQSQDADDNVEIKGVLDFYPVPGKNDEQNKAYNNIMQRSYNLNSHVFILNKLIEKFNKEIDEIKQGRILNRIQNEMNQVETIRNEVADMDIEFLEKYGTSSFLNGNKSVLEADAAFENGLKLIKH